MHWLSREFRNKYLIHVRNVEVSIDGPNVYLSAFPSLETVMVWSDVGDAVIVPIGSEEEWKEYLRGDHDEEVVRLAWERDLAKGVEWLLCAALNPVRSYEMVSYIMASATSGIGDDEGFLVSG